MEGGDEALMGKTYTVEDGLNTLCETSVAETVHVADDYCCSCEDSTASNTTQLEIYSL